MELGIASAVAGALARDRRQVKTCCDSAHAVERSGKAGSDRLFHNTRLELIREPPPAACPIEYFQPTNGRRLHLKHIVKFRHEPISNLEAGTIALSKTD